MSTLHKRIWWGFAGMCVIATSAVVILWLPNTKEILSQLTDLLILLLIITLIVLTALIIAVRMVDRPKGGMPGYITVNKVMPAEQALLYVHRKHPHARLLQISSAEKATRFLIIISIYEGKKDVRYAFENSTEPFELHRGGILLADHPTLNVLLRKQAIDAILKDLA